MTLNKEEPVTSIKYMDLDTHKSMVLVTYTGVYGIGEAFDILELPRYV